MQTLRSPLTTLIILSCLSWQSPKAHAQSNGEGDSAHSPVEREESEGSKNDKKSKTKKKRLNETDNEELDDSSAVMRKGKRAMVTLSLLGHDMVGFSKIGVDGLYFVKPNFLIGGGYNHDKSAGVMFKSREIGFESRTASTFTVYGKRFFGNSFYGSLGVAHRNVSAEVMTTDFQNVAGYVQEYQGQHIFVTIGNQWQWKHFTLGCDWFGVYSPYLAKKMIRDESVRGTSNTDLPKAKDTPEEAGSIPRVLVFYLGVSL